MCKDFQSNFVFLCQVHRRCATSMKAGAKLKGTGAKKDKLKKTINRKTDGISQ